MNIKKLIKINFQQMIFVVIAFSLMVLVSYISVSAVLRVQLYKNAEKEMDRAEADIRSKFIDCETTLVTSAMALGHIIDEGGSHEAALEFLTAVTGWLAENEGRMPGFNGIYGWVDGQYIDGSLWEPPDGYVPSERPWFKAALEAPGGAAAFTAPYTDANTHKIILSASYRFYAGEGETSVLSMDVDISPIGDYVRTLGITEGGRGALLDGGLNILAHADKALIGTNLEDMGGDYAGIASELLAGDTVSARRITGYDGIRSTVFYRKLFNGYYIELSSSDNVYYKDLTVTALTLTLLGLALAMSLGYFLLRFAAEKLRSDEENKNKTYFLARMSHEIRTPMNAIIGMSELLLRDGLPLSARENAASIKAAGDNLLSIINDILDFSKIESGTLEIIESDYALSSLINDVVSIIRMRLINKPVFFTCNVDAAIPDHLSGDETRVSQCILNLLGNAVKYTDQGFVSLDISGEIKNDVLNLTIAVEDSGRGIRESELGRLFGEFVQVDLKNNKKIEGTGLGLAITRSLLRMMGGDVIVSSRYGEGSVFTITLPQKIKSRVPIAPVSDPEKKPVLIYETRELFRRSLVRTLKNLGVPHASVQNYGELCSELEGGNYAFLFASSFLYDNISVFLKKSEHKAKLALISEFEDAVKEKNAIPLKMPAYSYNIANILNFGASERDAEKQSGRITFTAPEARVLVVDDIKTNLKVAEGLMSPYNMMVDVCLTGQEALEHARLHEYDIIFMDHMMPGMDGIEATAGIREFNREVPIIALTANAVSGMKEMFIQNGMNGLLPKPIELSKLNETLDKWISEEKKIKCEGEIQTERFTNIDIKGIDAESGLASLGGNKNVYVQTLETYRSDLKEKPFQVKNALSSGDIPLFTTYVHALKSASASVGAKDFSESARALEAAGRQEDMDYISRWTPKLLEDLSILAENIEKWLKANQNPNLAETGDGDELRDLLRELKEAVININAEEMNRALSDLQAKNWGDYASPAIADIAEDALMCEYDSAVIKIDNLLYLI